MEACLTGLVSPASSELTTLINLFITVLDGLIDEVPELFEPEKERIAELLDSSSPLWRHEIMISDRLLTHHPVVDVVYGLLLDGARRLRASSYLKADSNLRMTFLRAVEQAITAEYASRPIQTIGEWVEPERRRAVIEGKSEDAVWVTALVPICMNGWPNWLAQTRYESIARAIGRYFGWLDDLSDLFIDLANGRWNSVLIQIFREIQVPPTATPGEWQLAAATAISFESISSYLLDTGTVLYEDVVRKLDGLGRDCQAVFHLLADATASWLAPPVLQPPRT
jgi:hypothetical protein